jgi:hypothetical protein
MLRIAAIRISFRIVVDDAESITNFAPNLFLLRLLRGDSADIRDSRAFRHGRNGANIKDDTCDGRARFLNDVADVVCDVSNFHSGGDVGSAFYFRIKNSILITRNGDNFFDPHRIVDERRVTGKHFQVAHNIFAAVDERVDVFRLDGACVPGFSDGGGLASSERSVAEVARSGGITREISLNNDVIESEGEREVARDAINFFIPGNSVVAVRAKVFVEIAAMEIDQVVRFVDDLLRDQERNAVGLRAVHFAGIKSIHTFIVDGIYVRNFLLKRWNVDERNQNYCAGNLRRVERGDHPLDGDNGGVFRAVRAGNNGESRAGLSAAKYHDRNVSCDINAGGDVDKAGGFLAGDRDGRAYCEIVLLSLGGRGENYCCDEGYCSEREFVVA